MEKHVKIIGWLWFVNGVLGIILVLPGLAILNLTDSIPNAGDAVLITLGSLCFFLPGIIADFVAGFGLLKFQNWARILAIILAFFNLVFMCWMIIPAVVSIYTLVIMFNQETVSLFKGETAPIG
jgi:hypothetical protein